MPKYCRTADGSNNYSQSGCRLAAGNQLHHMALYYFLIWSKDYPIVSRMIPEISTNQAHGLSESASAMQLTRAALLCPFSRTTKWNENRLDISPPWSSHQHYCKLTAGRFGHESERAFYSVVEMDGPSSSADVTTSTCSSDSRTKSHTELRSKPVCPRTIDFQVELTSSDIALVRLLQLLDLDDPA